MSINRVENTNLSFTSRITPKLTQKIGEHTKDFWQPLYESCNNQERVRLMNILDKLASNGNSDILTIERTERKANNPFDYFIRLYKNIEDLKFDREHFSPTESNSLGYGIHIQSFMNTSYQLRKSDNVWMPIGGGENRVKEWMLNLLEKIVAKGTDENKQIFGAKEVISNNFLDKYR